MKRAMSWLLALAMLFALAASFAEQAEAAETLPESFDLRSVDTDGDGALTLGNVAEYTRAVHEERRDTLPDDFPFQIFQFYGEEDTVLFRR